MSVPITSCLLNKAAINEDEGKSRDILKERITANLERGGFSLWPCEHDPKCPIATKQQMFELIDAIPELVVMLDTMT